MSHQLTPENSPFPRLLHDSHNPVVIPAQKSPEEIERIGADMIRDQIDKAVPNKNDLLSWGTENLDEAKIKSLNVELQSGQPERVISALKAIERVKTSREDVTNRATRIETITAEGGFKSWAEMEREKGRLGSGSELFAARLLATPNEVIQGGSIEPDGSGRMPAHKPAFAE